jgi:cytoplasmic iron level regulating protein YaaA (DUF328/UPF0246 family)
MDLSIRSETLLIIPCCAKKETGGRSLDKYNDILSKSVDSKIYNSIISVRAELLNTLRKSYKCMNIQHGPDLGLHDFSSEYLPAIDRYKGTLYSAVPKFSTIIKNSLNSSNNPKILILSALYGPLHPLSMIQDYNLEMSGSAYQIWKIYFPIFLKEYVQKNKINNLNLYLGNSTYYFKVAKKAILPLKEKLINRAVQFEVENGSSYHTPHNHGLLVGEYLQNVSNSEFTRKIIENVL